MVAVWIDTTDVVQQFMIDKFAVSTGKRHVYFLPAQKEEGGCENLIISSKAPSGMNVRFGDDGVLGSLMHTSCNL